jgi:hypothetical protein
VEFLEYLTPRDGRAAPADARRAMVSAGVVAPPRREMGFARAFLGRDPDGHAFQVVER